MSTRLQHALETLYGLERGGGKLGLEGTRLLLRALGNPHTRFRSVHVAGTNGKGSVCALVERVLREAGVRTGLFTSPHLVDFRERIRVNGRWADEAWLESALERIAALPEAEGRTFFEVVTALGFLYFAEQRVDWAVVEVGLGGRLDCTNVLEPAVCAITSIGLDHAEMLGDTLEKIAAEKAGILKPGVPVVVAVDEPRARRVIEENAARVGAPIRTPESGSRTTAWRDISLEPESHARRFSNVPTALEILAALHEGPLPLAKEAVSRGIAAARWPGRLEACPTRPHVWWDGAHNLSAFASLKSEWFCVLRLEPPAVIVLALGRDKDAAAILDRLGRDFPGSRLIVTRTRSERAREPKELAELADARGLVVQTAPDVRTAADRALELAGEGLVLLTGSLFAVGEAMEAFGGAPEEWL